MLTRLSLKNVLRLPYQEITEYTGDVDLSLEALAVEEKTPPLISASWSKWVAALKQVFPLYLAIHLAALFITCLSTLYLQRDFNPNGFPIYQLWQVWNRWDTGHYVFLATSGYTIDRTVFFPLYPLLIHMFIPLLHNNALITGLIISSVADLVWMVALYQLVLEDFDQVSAQRTILYLSIFPTAFFFLAVYTESLFLALAVLSFYHARRGNWWLSGLFGLLACLTRQTGVILILPFCYEYLRQHQFHIRKISVNVISGLLIPAGVGIFAFYCWTRFGDPLSFSHEESLWQRQLMLPWWGMLKSVGVIRHGSGLLNFLTLRNLTDLLPDLAVLSLITLGCIGPWRLKKEYWAYLFYAIPLFLMFNMYPKMGGSVMPLESVGRYMLELFPAFIILAVLGKSRWLHMSYMFVASSICYFLLTQFLTGHWVL
jgi:Gpi18-like mannosyltransferase